VPEIMSFRDALANSGSAKRHLLLGNGFSMAWRSDIFAYGALFDQAKKCHLSKDVTEVFTALGTTDFEVVMRALRNAAALISVYLKKDKAIAAKMLDDANKLRDVLAKTISDSHPERPHDVKPEQYVSCRRFLSHFNAGSIYTLNYDLLLYWTLMQNEIEPDLRSDDGFRTSDDGPDDYVTWDIEKTSGQNIFYLHGALHFFDAGADLLKFTWTNTQTALIDQIRTALAGNRYPLIVAEGSSEEKMAKIAHSNLLSRGYRSFSQIGGHLFVYGHSLADNDEHLIKLIDKGKTNHVYIGIYGDANSAGNKKIIQRVQQIPTKRHPRHPAEIHFYDAASAHVWDGVAR